MYQEIANQVKSQFTEHLPSEYTDWSKVPRDKYKFDMVHFALKLVKENNLKTITLIKVFDELKINIAETNKLGKKRIRTAVYNIITGKTYTSSKTVAKPIQYIEEEEVKIADVDFLENIDNNQYSKMNWFRHRCMAGRQNEKKTKEDKDRGGYFSYGPQASRRDLEEHAIEFLKKMPDICPITKCKLDYGDYPVSRGYDSSNQEHTKHRATLDRHDPTIGYTFENTRVVSEFGNRNKGTMNVQDVERLLEYMYSQE